uniref:Uncharacterized protein n=1 Tax=Arundo donax TaxID=35708 RepID=A0A0A8YWD8_ARUDO
MRGQRLCLRALRLSPSTFAPPPTVMAPMGQPRSLWGRRRRLPLGL